MTLRRPRWGRVAATLLALAALAGVAAIASAAFPAKQDGEFTLVESPHFLICTDMSPEATQLMAVQQEALFNQIFLLIGSFKPAVANSTTKLSIVMTRTKEKADDAAKKYNLSGSGKSVLSLSGPPEGLDTGLEELRADGTTYYALTCLGPKCPAWVNAGLSAYFHNAQLRGIQLVAGQVPLVPLLTLRKAIADDKFVPLTDVSTFSSAEWVAAGKARGAGGIVLVDEAWAMVHWMLHADGGKYRRLFIQYMGTITSGMAPSQAWANAFGGAPAAFEKRLRDYIAALKPTEGLSCRVNLTLLGGLVAKSHGAVTDIKALRAMADEGQLADATYTTGDGLKVEFTDPAIVKMVFRCPEDTTPGDNPSYEVVPNPDGGPAIVRCRHHTGYTLETVYVKGDGDHMTIDVAARINTAKTATTDKKPAPSGAPKP